MRFKVFSKRTQREIGTVEITNTIELINGSEDILGYMQDVMKNKIATLVTRSKGDNLNYTFKEFDKSDPDFPLVFAERVNQDKSKYILVASNE